MPITNSFPRGGMDNTLIGDLQAVDRYNVPKVSYEEIGISENKEDIIPKAWTVVSDTECVGRATVIGGDIKLTASTASGSVKQACDGSTSTGWSSTTAGVGYDWVKLQFPYAIKITKMRTYISAYSTSYFTSATIGGSKDGLTWDSLYSITSVQTALTEITLNNPDYYQYYRIFYVYPAQYANSQGRLYEWQVSEWEGNTYGYINNLTIPLDSYDTRKIINIEGNSYINDAGTEITSFEKPYLNINNLGVKLINSAMKAGEKYTLIYNGESWDIQSNSPYVIGTYTGDGVSSRIIELGFTPSAVIVMMTSWHYNYVEFVGQDYDIGKVLGMAIKDYPQYTRAGAYASQATITVVDEGFSVKYYHDSSGQYGYYFNALDAVYSYIAFK